MIIEELEASYRDQLADLRTALADRSDLREVFLSCSRTASSSRRSGPRTTAAIAAAPISGGAAERIRTLRFPPS